MSPWFTLCMLNVAVCMLLAVDDSAESIKARQEEAFAMHSQERVLGLLGAMIPAENKVCTVKPRIQLLGYSSLIM